MKGIHPINVGKGVLLWKSERQHARKLNKRQEKNKFNKSNIINNNTIRNTLYDSVDRDLSVIKHANPKIKEPQMFMNRNICNGVGFLGPGNYGFKELKTFSMYLWELESFLYSIFRCFAREWVKLFVNLRKFR